MRTRATEQTYPRATSTRRRSRALPGGRLTSERRTSELHGHRPAPDSCFLDRLELLEGLAAALAVADRSTRRRPEDVLEPRLRRAAVRALERLALELDELRAPRYPRRGRG